MNGNNFTDRLRKVLQLAREEAFRLSHEYVGTEHLLLGLLLEGEGIGVAVLSGLAISPDSIRVEIERVTQKGRGSPVASPEIPYTSRAKKVLELAMTEARELQHTYIGTEHLLLGLLREEKGIAGMVLTDFSVTVANARQELVRIMGGNVPVVFDRPIPIPAAIQDQGELEFAQRQLDREQHKPVKYGPLGSLTGEEWKAQAERYERAFMIQVDRNAQARDSIVKLRAKKNNLQTEKAVLQERLAIAERTIRDLQNFVDGIKLAARLRDPAQC